ncbi:tetratricopeptide repeat protein [Maribacter halichondriae]|uniref:tetratricopeptide repeat protein n=1 Tax=Maribacter halichondriae TaxID=2980554 RepID=UPI0023589DF8|nr:tetratricopeptide repeat protein [Maribacter sp. Hal144]
MRKIRPVFLYCSIRRLFDNLWIVFCLLGFHLSAQTDSLVPASGGDKIWFSTIPNTKQESLEPYYKALKNAEYGVQRFSVIDQLAAFHIDQANTDSILYYGNLYKKEIALWDAPENAKKIHFSKAYYMLGVGNRFNGLLDNSIKWHINGITSGEEGNSSKGVYRNKIGLAKIYILKEEENKAISVLEEGLSAFEDELPLITNDALICLGDAFFNLKEYDEAKSLYEKAFEGAKNLGTLPKNWKSI